MAQRDNLQVDFLVDDAKARTAIENLRRQLGTLEASATRAYNALNKPVTSTDTLTVVSRRADEILARTRAAIAQRNRQEDERARLLKDSFAGIVGAGGGLGGLASGFIAGGLTALPIIFSQITAAVGQFAATSREAFLQFQAGTRILRAQSIETGIAFDSLVKKAESFGRATALGSGQAREVFGQLANFARAAGQTDKLDKFTQAFTDLASARGIKPEALGDIARQLNALVDEATDKLLNANPSAFFDNYARSIGKTAATLTDSEKRAAVFFAVIERGNLFLGQSAEKFNEVGGEALRVGKAYEDLKASIGESVTAAADQTLKFGRALSLAFEEALSNIGSFSLAINAALTGDASGLNRAIEERRAQITRAAESLNAPFEEAIRNDAKRAEANRVFIDNLNAFKARIADLQRKRAEALAGADKTPEGVALKSASEKLLSLEGIIDPASLQARQRQLDDLFAETRKSLSAQVDQLLAASEVAFTSGNRGLIRLFRKQFEGLQQAVPDLTARQKIFDQFRTALVGSFERDIEKAGRDVEKLKSVLAEIRRAGDLSGEDSTKLITNVSRAIDESVRAATGRVNDLRRAVTTLFEEQRTRLSDNPFLRIAQSSAAAFERIREVTKGLGSDIRGLFLRIQEQIAGIERAKARIDTATQAAELESEAQGFRRPISDVVERRLTERIRAAGFDVAANGELINLSQRQALDEFIKNERERLTAEEETARRRELIRQKIEAAGSGISDAEQRLADRAIIDATRGVDVGLLTPELRNAAAAAREREAERLRSSEAEATRLTAEQTQLQSRISQTLEGLYNLARSRGVDAIIRIIDDTGGRVSARSNVNVLEGAGGLIEP